jgi:hypothetical protein
MSLRIARRYSRTSIVHAVVVPCFVVAVALAAKCGGDASRASSDVAKGGGAPAAASGGSSSASSSDPKTLCAALLPQVQALIKMPLTLKSADDSHTGDMHTGEEGFVRCVNGSGGYRATVIMSSSPDKAFTSAPKKGYETLPGFGDVARS